MSNNYGHIMIDIETMGNTSYSSVLNIGAVEFNIETGEIGKAFEVDINFKSCLDLGLGVNADTILWWMAQSEASRKRIIDGQKKAVDVYMAMHNFRVFVNSCGGKDVFIWGNSPRFDLGLLQNIYTKINSEIPWNFRNERDIRTLVSFKPEIKANSVSQGIEHNGIDDCRFQIDYVVRTYNAVLGNGK